MTAALQVTDQPRFQVVRCAHPAGRHVLCRGVLFEAVAVTITTHALQTREEFTLKPRQAGSILRKCPHCHGWNAVTLQI